METAGKKQGEPVFRLQSSVRGEIEWLLMVCNVDDYFGHVSSMIAEMLAKMTRVKLVVICGMKSFADTLHEKLSGEPFFLKPVIVQKKEHWQTSRCFLITPTQDPSPHNFETFIRDPFHILQADDPFQVLFSEHGKQGRSNEGLVEFLATRLMETGFGEKGYLRTENHPRFMVQGGNLLCDAGNVFVGSTQLLETPGGENWLLSFANGGENTDVWSRVIVLGKQPSGKIKSLYQSLLALTTDKAGYLEEQFDALRKLFFDPLFLQAEWTYCEAPNSQGDVLPVHVDYFLTLTGAQTGDKAPRPIVFLAKVANVLRLKDCEGKGLGTFVRRLNKRLERVEKQLKNAGIEVIRNKIPLVEWQDGEGGREVFPFFFNNCLMEVFPTDAVGTVYVCRVSTRKEEQPSRRQKLQTLENDWAGQWTQLPGISFDVKFIEADIFPWARGFGTLHCITKELSRYPKTSSTNHSKTFPA